MASRECEMAEHHHCNIITFKDGQLKYELHNKELQDSLWRLRRKLFYMHQHWMINIGVVIKQLKKNTEQTLTVKDSRVVLVSVAVI
jgi:hypothetical protein